jgi:hypothetical protein
MTAEKAGLWIDSKNEVLALRLEGRVRRVERGCEVDCLEFQERWLWLTEKWSVAAATKGKVKAAIWVKSSAIW